MWRLYQDQGEGVRGQAADEHCEYLGCARHSRTIRGMSLWKEEEHAKKEKFFPDDMLLPKSRKNRSHLC